jgi:hypothetical protein
MLEDSNGLVSNELPGGLCASLVVGHAVGHVADGLKELALQVVRGNITELRLDALDALANGADLDFNGDHVARVGCSVCEPDRALT